MALVLFGCDTDNWSWKIVKRLVGAAGSISEKILGWKRSDEGQRVYTHESEGQKTNSGLILKLATPKETHRAGTMETVFCHSAKCVKEMIPY